MRTALAERLLAKIMSWTQEEVQTQRPLLQALANFKYDEYQQYSPGIRFIESLVRWLRQFEKLDQRIIAYDFFLNQLIFISGDQMSYLVSLAFSEKVEPKIIEKTAIQMGVSKYLVRPVSRDDKYKTNLRQSLFIGLSDGAKIDSFRRISGISNEQVSTTYYISTDKAADLITKLERDTNTNKFTTIFLIDDFTGSGRSFFRPEEGSEKAGGKLAKFIRALHGNNTDDSGQNDLSKLVDISNITIHVLFYIATVEAIENMRSSIADWILKENISLEIEIDAIQFLDDTIKTKVLADTSFLEIAKNQFDIAVLTDSYKVGKYANPYLGFNECALPVVLNHNTPNNSLPILWFEGGEKDCKGLFPRITRHKI